MKDLDGQANWTVEIPPELDLLMVHADVYVWRISQAPAPNRLAVLHSWLTDFEIERASKYRNPDLTQKYIVRHGLLRELLSHLLGCPPKEIPIQLSATGKPRCIFQAPRTDHLPPGIIGSLAQSQAIPNPLPMPGRGQGGGKSNHAKSPSSPGTIESEKECLFNVSHSKDECVFAVSRYPVGIDIEYVDRDFPTDPMINDVFTVEEQAYLNHSEDRTRAFFQIWTRKEAVLKSVGVGLGASMRDLSVLDARIEYERTHLALVDFEPFSRYHGALAIAIEESGQGDL